MPFAPTTDVSDLKDALGTVAANDISGVDRVYTDEPDGPPEDGSVVIGCPAVKVDDATSGKLCITWIFPVRYLVLRRGDGEDIRKAEGMLLPLILAYTAWYNQELDADAFEATILNGGIVQFIYAGQVYRAATVNIEVTSEYNIPIARS